MYESKNYFTDGGNELVIGGKLTFEGDGAPVENQANSTATTVAGLKDDFNALLGKLKSAGLMAADEEAGT